jgi:hypothetical protein
VKPAALTLAFALGCGAAPVDAPVPTPTVAPVPTPFSEPWLQAQADRYLSADPSHRRRALERSLRNPENTYSRTRLSAYARADLGWDLLPEWTPRVRAVDGELAQELAAGRLWRSPTPPRCGTASARRPSPQWQALGRRVFFSYPLRPEVFAEHALMHPDVARAVGLRAAPDGSVPGTVAFIDIDGRARVGITCALCHVALEQAAWSPAGPAATSTTAPCASRFIETPARRSTPAWPRAWPSGAPAAPTSPRTTTRTRSRSPTCGR